MKNDERIIYNRLAITVIGIVCIIVTIAIIIISYHKSPVYMAKQELSIGEKYLDELDFENAILHFQRAYDIADKNQDVVSKIHDGLLHILSSVGQTDDIEEKQEILRPISEFQTRDQSIQRIVLQASEMLEEIEEQLRKQKNFHVEENVETNKDGHLLNEETDGSEEDKEYRLLEGQYKNLTITAIETISYTGTTIVDSWGDRSRVYYPIGDNRYRCDERDDGKYEIITLTSETSYIYELREIEDDAQWLRRRYNRIGAENDMSDDEIDAKDATLAEENTEQQIESDKGETEDLSGYLGNSLAEIMVDMNGGEYSEISGDRDYHKYDYDIEGVDYGFCAYNDSDQVARIYTSSGKYSFFGVSPKDDIVAISSKLQENGWIMNNSSPTECIFTKGNYRIRWQNTGGATSAYLYLEDISLLSQVPGFFG